MSKVIKLVFASGKNNVTTNIFTKVLSDVTHSKLTQTLLGARDVLPRGE